MMRYFINTMFNSPKKLQHQYGEGYEGRLVKKHHKDLFQLLIDGSKTRVCDHCSQVDHKTPFSQLNSITSYNFRSQMRCAKKHERYNQCDQCDLVSKLSGRGPSIVPINVPYYRVVGVFCNCCFCEKLLIQHGCILF